MARRNILTKEEPGLYKHCRPVTDFNPRLHQLLDDMKDTLAQDRQAMAGYFRPDAVIRWHCTNEQFTVPEFIRANCEYPGEWDGKIERTERSGDLLRGEILVRVLRQIAEQRLALLRLICHVAFHLHF